MLHWIYRTWLSLPSIQNRKLSGLEPESVEEAIKRTKQWMAEIQPLVAQSKTGWCFDTTEPNALDAHLVVFLARLHDVRRDNLVPESVRKYGEVAMNQKAWKNTMEDRRTMPPQWFAWCLCLSHVANNETRDPRLLCLWANVGQIPDSVSPATSAPV